jgi:hypothetical protein
MDDKTIQFIDSDYNELFRIPDGGNIKIIYPPGDDRGTVTRQCVFFDETHTRVGNNDYHIREFAERMEGIGARYEPEFQIAAELAPGGAADKAMFYYNRDEGNTCVGHLRGDFGKQGDQFWHNWSDRDGGRKTPEFQTEFNSVMFTLRQGVLKNYDSMAAYCRSHPEARISGEEFRYGLKLETESREFFLRCTTLRDDYFYIYAYDKPASVLEYENAAIPNTLTPADMYAYGYAWDGMEPLDRQSALARFDAGREVYLLYDDGTEGAAESREGIEEHDGIFGAEIPGWEEKPLSEQTPIEVFILNQDISLGGKNVGEWLSLPASAEDLRELFVRIGIVGSTYNDYSMPAFRCSYDAVRDVLYTGSRLNELDMLAVYMRDMEPWQLDKLQAVLQSGLAAHTYGASGLLNIISEDNFSNFVVIDAKNEEELGRYWAREAPDAFPEGMSPAEYGRECIAEEKGVFTEWGYVYNRSVGVEQEYSGFVPQKYRITDEALRAAPEKDGGRPSVVKHIRDAKAAAHSPRKSKTTHKGDTEI